MGMTPSRGKKTGRCLVTYLKLAICTHTSWSKVTKQSNNECKSRCARWRRSWISTVPRFCWYLMQRLLPCLFGSNTNSEYSHTMSNKRSINQHHALLVIASLCVIGLNCCDLHANFCVQIEALEALCTSPSQQFWYLPTKDTLAFSLGTTTAIPEVQKFAASRR